MSSEKWERTKELLEQALRLAPKERQPFLAAACGDDAELRREVESLLASHEEAGSEFMDAAAPEILNLVSTAGLTPGTKIRQYEIIGQLGAGGMGEVYHARDTNLHRDVAIKILPAAFSADRDRLARFEREAQSASALNHPNIVTIYELGQEGSSHYIAMELVKGKTLRELLVSGMLPIRKAIEIAVQVAEGLAKAHEAGVTHRDLKPENLMVTQEGFAKILDFGLAKLELKEEARENLTTTSLTTSGLILGTVGYMSPEQAAGGRPDFRSDQFSFGLVLYEIVTGKRAFRRRTAAETLVAILREQPESISSINPGVPPPLCWVVERCLAKEPEKRYFSTRDLARDLAAIRDRLMDLQPRPQEARPSNLPIPGSAFVGHGKELAAAKKLLLRKEVRLITVTGPAGIGKSRLALELARDMTEHFPSGIYFVALAAISDPNAVPTLIAQALGVHETAGRSQLDSLKEYLQTLAAPVLLLIDNFEHLIAAAPKLTEIMAMAMHLKVLVTSRAALRVYDEYEFPVPPLELPDAKSPPTIDTLPQYSAISLFVQRATAVKPDFKFNESNASAVVEICSRLDGLPLAIELAAARIKLLSPSAMRTRLASRLQLLTGGARDLPARQQTIRQAIDWSYDLLSEPEQKLFRRLPVFVGGCSLEAVESVCDTKQDLGLDVLDGMTSMVDKSLAQQSEQADGEPRFRMLETIREYALEKLAESGELKQIRRAHAAYCLVLAEEGAAENSAANQTEWRDRFELEHDNFRAALDWLIETGDAAWGLRLGAALFRFWETREYLAEGREQLGRLLRLPAAAPSDAARLRVLFSAGVLTAGQGDYVAATALLKDSLELGRLLNDKRCIAVSINALAVTARNYGDLAGARSLFEESLTLWREMRDSPAVARALSNLASLVKLEGDYARSRSMYEESLSIFRELGDRNGAAWALNYQGDVARDQGDSVAARSLYEQSLAAFRELNDRWGIAGSLADLGNLAREQGDLSTAELLFQESLGIFQSLEHKRGIARLLESFACCAAAQSDPGRSLRLAGASAALRQSIGVPLTPAEQAKLEKGLEPARRALATTTARTAWLEGWVMPIEKAIEDVLRTRV